MNGKRYEQRQSTLHAPRQVEGEGVLRMLLLVFALALPLASMAYLKIQHTRMSYEMSDLREKIHQEEEARRTLLLERSRYQRDEEVQAFATRTGLTPRPQKQSHLIPTVFTKEDQKLAKLLPPGGMGI
jgi:cell division protein FtsL